MSERNFVNIGMPIPKRVEKSLEEGYIFKVGVIEGKLNWHKMFKLDLENRKILASVGPQAQQMKPGDEVAVLFNRDSNYPNKRLITWEVEYSDKVMYVYQASNSVVAVTCFSRTQDNIAHRCMVKACEKYTKTTGIKQPTRAEGLRMLKEI